MFCKECGYQLPDDSIFCTECGTKLNSTSPSPAQSVPKNNAAHQRVTYTAAPAAVNKSINPVLVALLIIVITIITIIGAGGGYLYYRDYSEKNVPKKTIVSNIIGSEICIDGEYLEITSDNLKETNIIEKDIETEFGIRTVDYTGSILLKTSTYSVEVPFEIGYIFLGSTRSWELAYQTFKTSSIEVDYNY